MSKKTAEKKVCPDCGKELRADQTTYGIYRNEYQTKENPQGHLYVCENCYRGQ